MNYQRSSAQYRYQQSNPFDYQRWTPQQPERRVFDAGRFSKFFARFSTLDDALVQLITMVKENINLEKALQILAHVHKQRPLNPDQLGWVKYGIAKLQEQKQQEAEEEKVAESKRAEELEKFRQELITRREQQKSLKEQDDAFSKLILQKAQEFAETTDMMKEDERSDLLRQGKEVEQKTVDDVVTFRMRPDRIKRRPLKSISVNISDDLKEKQRQVSVNSERKRQNEYVMKKRGKITGTDPARKEAKKAREEAEVQAQQRIPDAYEEAKDVEETARTGEDRDEQRESARMTSTLPGSAVPRGAAVPVGDNPLISHSSVTFTPADIVGVHAPPSSGAGHAATTMTMPMPTPAPVLTGNAVIDQSYVPKGQNLPGMIVLPTAQLQGNSNAAYFAGGANSSQMGHNSIFKSKSKQAAVSAAPTDNLWWLTNPLKMDSIDKQMAVAAQKASEPNEENLKRQRKIAERELSKFPRYRLYAGSDHVAEEILSHKSF